MRKGRKFAAVLAAALFVSAVPVTAFGAVIQYSPSKTSTVDSSKYAESELSEAVDTVKTLIESGKMTVDEIKNLGPGYAAAFEEYSARLSGSLGIGLNEALEEEEDTSFNGPTVNKVELGQIYHDEYKTYELSMAGQYFLYANVGNGGITHEPVMIDIPANVSYTVEKDGLPYEYVSKTYISAKGTYVMTLMGIENKDAPLSEQKEYQATFRFRIQDAPPVEESEAAENTSTGTGSSSGSSGLVISGNSGAPSIAIPEASVPTETEPAVEPTEESKEAVTEPDDKAETEPESEPADGPEGVVLVEREQRMELATGNYIVTLENGKELTTSVPEGYVGTGSVYLSVAADDAAITKLYKNDEPIDFINGGSVTDYGRYRVEVDGYSYFFTLAYEVGQMEYYPAPAGMAFTEVRLNDELVTLASDQYVEMDEDGTYTFVMKGADGERMEVALIKDTVAPEMNVTVSKSSAAIEYVSDDIKVIELTKDGNEVPGFRGNSAAEPGKYTLTVYDAAGNSTSADFTLRYQVNMYGILAVVLVILAVAGIGAFVVYTKKNTKVR